MRFLHSCGSPVRGLPRTDLRSRECLPASPRGLALAFRHWLKSYFSNFERSSVVPTIRYTTPSGALNIKCAGSGASTRFPPNSVTLFFRADGSSVWSSNQMDSPDALVYGFKSEYTIVM